MRTQEHQQLRDPPQYENRPSSLLQVFTFYEHYLDAFYASNPGLANAPYTEQMRRLREDGFCGFHVYAPYLTEIGIRSNWVVANCEQTQKRWALENNVRFRPSQWREDILRAQIASYDPEVLYTLNPLDFDSKFIRTLPKRPAYIVGWRAADIPAGIDWREFDLILSHLSVCRERALQIGARDTAFFHPSLPEFFKDIAADIKPEFDVVFSGQWTPQHGVRNRIITALAEAADRGEFSLRLFLCSHHFELPAVVRKFNAGARWGHEMYKSLKLGRIVVNAEIDLARGEAGNLRLYEATAVGSFLLTENQANIDRYLIPGKHIDTYSSVESMLEKIRYYLKNSQAREAMAHEAQRHMFEAYSMESGAKKLCQILTDHLKSAKVETKPKGDLMQQQSQVESVLTAALQSLRASDAGKALAIIETAADFGDVTRDFHHIKAVCLSKLSRMDEAIVELRREVHFFPDNHPARDLLGFLEEAFGLKIETALPARLSEGPLSEPSPSLNPSKLAAEIGDCLRAGDLVLALSIAEKLASECPAVMGVQYLRGVALKAAGRLEEGRSAMIDELMRHPGNAAARREFEEISEQLGLKLPPPINPEQREAPSEEILLAVRHGMDRCKYRGESIDITPFDRSLISMLLWDIKPHAVIEVGAKSKSSSRWIADSVSTLGLNATVYTIDNLSNPKSGDSGIQHVPLDLKGSPSEATSSWFEALPRPLLVIVKAGQDTDSTLMNLEAIHPQMRGGEYLLIEAQSSQNDRQPVSEFIARHSGEYDIDGHYADLFGYNCTGYPNGFLRRKQFAINPSIQKQLIREFFLEDPVPLGMESQMSVNERFQLYMTMRTLLPRTQKMLRYVEIGSHAGASFKLEYIAARRDGRQVHPIAIEPGGLPSFYDTVREISATHIKAFSHPARTVLEGILQDGILPEFIMVDGDHSYEGVLQDIQDYYQLLAPGGIMVFHDFLPAIDPSNREAIFFHHGGKEPGIRRACQELMEQHFHAAAIELPLLYPTDPTQTQPHLPVIPGVFSTIKVYRKPF